MFAVTSCDSTLSALFIALVAYWLVAKVYTAADEDGEILTALKDAAVRCLSRLWK